MFVRRGAGAGSPPTPPPAGVPPPGIVLVKPPPRAPDLPAPPRAEVPRAEFALGDPAAAAANFPCPRRQRRARRPRGAAVTVPFEAPTAANDRGRRVRVQPGEFLQGCRIDTGNGGGRGKSP